MTLVIVARSITTYVLKSDFVAYDVSQLTVEVIVLL